MITTNMSLSDAHSQHLLQSGISQDVIRERGYKTVVDAAELERLGFINAQCRVPGILIPLYAPDDTAAGFQFRPDGPRINNRGKLIKYETPLGARLRIDMPKRSQQYASNPEVPLYVTEGAKKADSLATAGVCAVNLSGVWGFKSRNEFGAPILSADFDLIAWKGRIVYLCFDSDITTKREVYHALEVLGAHVQRKGGKPFIVQLPSGPKGEKVGVDDFLAAGHTIDDLIALASPLSTEAEADEPNEIHATHFEFEGRLYLEVHKMDDNYAFAHLEGDKVVLSSEVVMGQKTIRPRTLPQVEGQTLAIVGLPSEGMTAATPYDAKTLLKRVKDHIAKYVDLEPRDLELAVYYVLFTWYTRKVNTAAYLRFLADTGKGKTRARQVIGDICFYPVYASGAGSFSGMARTQQKWRGTLIIDEADFSGEKESQVTKYLNLGFERGQYYILSDKMNPRNQDYFDPFGPKVIAMRETFDDNATEARLLSVSMRETHDPNIPIILDSEYKRDMRQLRDEIARFVVTHWGKVDGGQMLRFDDLQIEPRLKQLAMPLSVIFQLWSEGVEGFKEYLTARQTEIRCQRAMSWAGTLANTVLAMASGDLDTGDIPAKAVTPTMVCQYVRSTPKAVTKGLTGIGFLVEQRWIDGYDAKGNPKRRQVRAYVIPNSTVYSEIMSRYWYSDDGAKPPEIPDILRSAKYVLCGEASHVSQPSQNHVLGGRTVTHVTDVTVLPTGIQSANEGTDMVDDKVPPGIPCVKGTGTCRLRTDPDKPLDCAYSPKNCGYLIRVSGGDPVLQLNFEKRL